MTKVVVVNEKDEVVGAVDKSAALEKELIRRIVRIFVFNTKGELFLQHRSADKDTYPNTWDQSAGGHVDEGEDYETAAKRELKEELGVENVVLKEVLKFYTGQKFGEYNLKEFSMLYKTTFNGKIKINNKEIDGGKWFSLFEIDRMMRENKSDFPPGFIKAFGEYNRIITKGYR